MSSRRSLIRLSDNPYGDEDELAPQGADDMGMGGGGDEGGEDEQPFGEEPEEDEMSGMYSMQKGRRVSGPRVKLSLSERTLFNGQRRIENAIVDLAESVASLAKSNSTVVKSLLRKEEDEDEEKDEKEDKARVGKARVRKEDYESETGIGGTKDAGEDRTSEDETKNELGITEGDLTKGRKLAKDDAASSFGEKDDDIPGNREAGVDEKDKSPEDILIQGDSSAGPGPTSVSNSAQLQNELNKAVAAVYARHGLVMKAQGARIGTGGVGNEPSMADMSERARALSFKELNRKRVELGDLPDGLI
jgi:hypothetical protein